MNSKALSHFFLFVCLFVSLNTVLAQDDSPRWNIDPRTRIDLAPDGNYVQLPEGDNMNFSNEVRYINTPQGVFAVGPNFRVHPTTARTQSETPITVHPRNPRIMFASSNNYNVGGLTTFSTAHYTTTDGGVTWFGDDTTVFNFGDPGPMIHPTLSQRLAISFIKSNGAIGAAWSSNMGTTWTEVSFPGATTAGDKNLSAVDGHPTSAFYGRMYTVYTEFSGAYVNRIVLSWSSDGGATWSSVVPVSPVPSAGHHHQGCDVTVDVFGWVRIVWANCTTNGQNSTEDYLGWAESPDGGVTFLDVSDTKVNMNGIRTSDLLTPSNVAIRANGFPRISDDRSCYSSDGNEYVVAGEKNFAPALDNADIVLMKTVDGGSSWTRTRVNQNPAGSYEYFPAVHVDRTGGINVCYYSTRNVPTNDSAQIYLSRSVDGGTTWTDVLVSDHKFKPVPISGLATGYQGDYIGITAGGDGKIYPYWCEQNTSTGGRYQAYTAAVDISKPLPICDDFSCNKDTGSTSVGLYDGDVFTQFTAGTTNFWNRRSTASAYNIGSGSARFNSWSALSGTTQSLVTYDFPSAPANTWVSFDHAYAPYSGGNVDSLIVESSANSGATWSVRQRLWGGLGAQAGPLNTVFVGGGQFTPTGGQWRSKIYSLPVGTNKVRLRGVSGFGNDIWIDNLCVQTLPAPVANTVGIAHQGMWINSSPYWTLLDTITIYLHRSDFPGVCVDSAKQVVGSNAVVNNIFFNRALSGNYYKVIKHRNTIETWSSAGINYTRGSNTHYNFIVPAGQSYGNNQALVNSSLDYYAMYTGEVVQDSIVDLSDIVTIYVDANNFLSGYVTSDCTGDNFVDLSDLTVTYNNASIFVARVAPPGGAPAPGPTVEELTKSLSSATDEERNKILLTIEYLKQQQATDDSPVKNKVTFQEGIEMIKRGQVNELVEKVMSTIDKATLNFLEAQRKANINNTEGLPEPVRSKDTGRPGEL